MDLSFQRFRILAHLLVGIVEIVTALVTERPVSVPLRNPSGRRSWKSRWALSGCAAGAGFGMAALCGLAGARVRGA